MAAAAATRRGVILFIISLLLFVSNGWKGWCRPSIDNGACEVIDIAIKMVCTKSFDF